MARGLWKCDRRNFLPGTYLHLGILQLALVPSTIPGGVLAQGYNVHKSRSRPQTEVSIREFSSQKETLAMAQPTVPAGSSLKTELTQFAHRRNKEGPYADSLDVDVLIVGAGFGNT